MNNRRGAQAKSIGSNNRALLLGRGFKVDRTPGFTTYYDLGVRLSKEMPVFCTYAEIGARFGITKQNAYTESVVALGKVAYRMRTLMEERTQ